MGSLFVATLLLFVADVPVLSQLDRISGELTGFDLGDARTVAGQRDRRRLAARDRELGLWQDVWKQTTCGLARLALSARGRPVLIQTFVVMAFIYLVVNLALSRLAHRLEAGRASARTAR